MTTTKVTLTIPTDVLQSAKRQVQEGRAKSLSALVSEALDEKLRRAELDRILGAMDAEHGSPDREARAWARRALSAGRR
jgi:Arc/MetJ-type ribon-helix-helix transcriptional regulator